ncbi:MAG: hypothetical protein Q7W30_09630 [Coriobacteriia bacterium]|nr:hypothetical protein [Coriobacteriia bacterium]
MKAPRRTTLIIAGLLGLAALLYVGLYVLFPRRLQDIEFYTLLDVAFIPLNVLIVSLVIDRLLAAREREALLHKMNMVVGAFFSEVGRDLIDRLVEFDSDIAHDREHMLFTAAWKAEDYDRHRAVVCDDGHPMSLTLGDIPGLRANLEEKRGFILGLLQNGNLLEHQSFTDMLWAVSHLSEELSARKDLTSLSGPDLAHIELDLGRAYGRLLGEYLLYIKHLKADYPYLFAFAARTNPFDPDARIEVG